MKIMVLGGDGYLGWPTAMHFSENGHEVAVLDNCIKRKWEKEQDVKGLFDLPTLERRVITWNKSGPEHIEYYHEDMLDFKNLKEAIKSFKPEAIIHYAEQPSAPYSMISVKQASETQINNVIGNMNLMWAVKEVDPNIHIIKLGTMGEYGTPNIDIEEGFLDIEYKGRKDTIPMPKAPGSFYHLTKVHDSNNLMFAVKIWGLKVTDLNQGVVYGIETPETSISESLTTNFHYDAIFGTALNRFCAQAVMGEPITLYGAGTQKRAFLNINDTLQCVTLAATNPPKEAGFRVFNQFTEVFSIKELAELVAKEAKSKGYTTKVECIENPRVESEEHYYNPVNDNFIKLGLKPRKLSEVLVDSMLDIINKHKSNIDVDALMPKIKWK